MLCQCIPKDFPNIVREFVEVSLDIEDRFPRLLFRNPVGVVGMDIHFHGFYFGPEVVQGLATLLEQLGERDEHGPLQSGFLLLGEAVLFDHFREIAEVGDVGGNSGSLIRQTLIQGESDLGFGYRLDMVEVALGVGLHSVGRDHERIAIGRVCKVLADSLGNLSPGVPLHEKVKEEVADGPFDLGVGIFVGMAGAQEKWAGLVLFWERGNILASLALLLFGNGGRLSRGLGLELGLGFGDSRVGWPLFAIWCDDPCAAGPRCGSWRCQTGRDLLPLRG
jgi:hypothetical protein